MTEQDEPWYDAEDIAEWEEVLRAAVRAAHDASEKAQARLTGFQYLALQLRGGPTGETRDRIRKGLTDLAGVPLMPRPLPAQPDPPPMSPEELEAANKRHRETIAEYKKMDSAASAERIAAEMELRRAKAEKYTAGWDDAAAALHQERLREYRKKLSADHVITENPETWPVWPKEWGPM